MKLDMLELAISALKPSVQKMSLTLLQILKRVYPIVLLILHRLKIYVFVTNRSYLVVKNVYATESYLRTVPNVEAIANLLINMYRLLIVHSVHYAIL